MFFLISNVLKIFYYRIFDSLFLFAFFFNLIDLSAQYTYPIYGGVMRSVGYADSNSSNIISIFSVSSQKIRLTNYSDYDTSISITANKVLDAFIPKKYFCLGVSSNTVVANRTIFIEAGKPLTVSLLDIFQPSGSSKQITGKAGSYQSIEKSNCGTAYLLYHPKSCHYSYTPSSTTKKYRDFAYCFTVVAFDDQTEVQFDLNFDTELGRKFTKKLNRGETFQISIKYPRTPFANDETDFKLHVVNGGKITSKDCRKKLAVYSNNFGLGFTKSQTWLQIDQGLYPFNGFEIEQLQPIQSWGYEFIVASEGKSYMGNTYHLFSGKGNTIWINGKMTVIGSDTVIADTVFYKPLLIQSLKPIAITQYVSGTKNLSAFGAPDDQVYANVLDFASIPPTNVLTKEMAIPIPTSVGTSQMNRVVIFSPGNNKIEVNGKASQAKGKN